VTAELLTLGKPMRTGRFLDRRLLDPGVLRLVQV